MYCKRGRRCWLPLWNGQTGDRPWVDLAVNTSGTTESCGRAGQSELGRIRPLHRCQRFVPLHHEVEKQPNSNPCGSQEFGVKIEIQPNERANDKTAERRQCRESYLFLGAELVVNKRRRVYANERDECPEVKQFRALSKVNRNVPASVMAPSSSTLLRGILVFALSTPKNRFGSASVRPIP
jgi:hypothetical protein